VPKSALLEVVGTADLTDADWSVIGKAQQAYSEGGSEALWKLLDELLKDDPIRYRTVVRAFFSVLMTEGADETVEQGMTFDEVRELLRKLESRPRKR
jgi:hypothetical protein